MNTILLKRKTTTGAPSSASLQTGEACYVLPDKKLYIKNDDNTVTVINSSGGGSAIVKGTANISFVNQKESKIIVLDPSINNLTIVTVGVEISTDETFIEDFQTRVTKESGIGFTIFCNPRIGKYTGSVTVNYIIL